MFNSWLRTQTGLSLYDFRVLDIDGTSEQMVQGFFKQWLEDYAPNPQCVNEAIEEASEEGFELSITF